MCFPSRRLPSIRTESAGTGVSYGPAGMTLMTKPNGQIAKRAEARRLADGVLSMTFRFRPAPSGKSPLCNNLR